MEIDRGACATLARHMAYFFAPVLFEFALRCKLVAQLRFFAFASGSQIRGP